MSYEHVNLNWSSSIDMTWRSSPSFCFNLGLFEHESINIFTTSLTTQTKFLPKFVSFKANSWSCSSMVLHVIRFLKMPALKSYWRELRHFPFETKESYSSCSFTAQTFSSRMIKSFNIRLPGNSLIKFTASFLSFPSSLALFIAFKQIY